MAADRERAAEVAREAVAAREAEVAVNSTAEKHAADITARTSGGLRRGGWSRVAAVRARRRCSDGGAAWRRGVCCAALQLHGASSSGRSNSRRFGARTHASRCTSMLHTSRVVQPSLFYLAGASCWHKFPPGCSDTSRTLRFRWRTRRCFGKRSPTSPIGRCSSCPTRATSMPPAAGRRRPARCSRVSTAVVSTAMVRIRTPKQSACHVRHAGIP